ncbi:MAG: hypothetical protein AUJ92_13915 [Armatimonadetes bacterium CG2_30_59_28]|nr:MAG: hypothetical protein AUJ92_13915 [Armatimonadetes bacterium CG2_30_59_28]PIU61453.1 MAG: hypothetical protein COS85_20980 [Armatimonadetes bacterium CG07_land_8_20_14_0_80_59_28]
MNTETTTKPYPLAPDLWTFRGEAAYSGKLDHRKLLQIRHPSVESTEGGFGEWRARVSLPSDFEKSERVYLSFYTSDDYSGERLDEAGWLSRWTWGRTYNFNMPQWYSLRYFGSLYSDFISQGVAAKVYGREHGYPDVIPLLCNSMGVQTEDLRRRP